MNGSVLALRFLCCVAAINFTVLCSWQISRGETGWAAMDFMLAVVFLMGAASYAPEARKGCAMSSEHVVTEAEMAWKWVEGEVEANGYCCFTTPFYSMLRGLSKLGLLLHQRGWAIARNFSSGADVDEYVVYRRKG